MIDPVHGVLENLRDRCGIYNPLYTVRFELSELSTCHNRDLIRVDAHEEWFSGVRRDS